MINIVLSLQSKLDDASKQAVEEICKLSDAILKLQTELAVSWSAKKYLQKIKMEDVNLPR